MKNIKGKARQRRSRKARGTIARLGVARLVVRRTNQHMYASIILPGDNGTRVVASASTLKSSTSAPKKERAREIGQAIAERAKKAGIESVAFDRSGFKYHGCIKAVAEAAREGGMNF